MILNKPTCHKCTDYGYSPQLTGLTPIGGDALTDSGKVQLTAGVPYPISFTRISVISETKWMFAGLPLCYNDSGTIGYDITAKSGTGFTVTATDDATFEYTAVRI